MQVLFGDFDAEPFGHLLPMEPKYDFYFTGTTSDWSETQTITIGESQTPTSSPTTMPIPMNYTAVKLTEQETIIDAIITAAVIGTGLGLLIYLLKEETKSPIHFRFFQ